MNDEERRTSGSGRSRGRIGGGVAAVMTRSSSPSPRAPLRVGSIGASRVAPEHARAVEAAEAATLVGIADPDVPRAERVAEAYGCRVHADYRELLSAPDIDVVMLGLPNDLHCPIGL